MVITPDTDKSSIWVSRIRIPTVLINRKIYFQSFKDLLNATLQKSHDQIWFPICRPMITMVMIKFAANDMHFDFTQRFVQLMRFEKQIKCTG